MAKRGRKAVNMTAEERRKRNNESARKYKAKVREMASHVDTFGLNPDKICDKHGISPFDQRRYIHCFHSGWIGADVKLAYVKRMTGLSLLQIAILQERTGLLPVPVVTKQVARKDQRRRELLGDIY